MEDQILKIKFGGEVIKIPLMGHSEIFINSKLIYDSITEEATPAKMMTI